MEFNAIKKIYFIGIGGIGMSALGTVGVFLHLHAYAGAVERYRDGTNQQFGQRISDVAGVGYYRLDRGRCCGEQPVVVEFYIYAAGSIVGSLGHIHLFSARHPAQRRSGNWRRLATGGGSGPVMVRPLN